MEIPVIFRAERFNGDIVITAVFPTLIGTYEPHTFTIYAHIGQHGTGVKEWYWSTRPATEMEYAPLLKELRGIYETPHTLRIVKRFTAQYDRIRRESITR